MLRSAYWGPMNVIISRVDVPLAPKAQELTFTSMYTPRAMVMVSNPSSSLYWRPVIEICGSHGSWLRGRVGGHANRKMKRVHPGSAGRAKQAASGESLAPASQPASLERWVDPATDVRVAGSEQVAS
jgi:hypothetical protein